jgi:hypothetical protein
MDPASVFPPSGDGHASFDGPYSERGEPDELPRRNRPPGAFSRTLLDCGREIGLGARVNAAVNRIRIEDPPIAAVAPAEIENLRYGLNAIARWLP